MPNKEVTYRDENRLAYNKYAEKFETSTKDYLKNHLLGDVALFMRYLPGETILDVGSGPGRDALYLKEQNLQPVCIDISHSMVKLCREKGLEAHEMDLEEIQFADSSFDGIWAYTSLLHIPKEKLPKVFKKIKSLLRDEGILYLGMKEGCFAGFKEDERYPEVRRYSVCYSDKELRELLSEDFMLLHASKVELDGKVYLNYLCQVR